LVITLTDGSKLDPIELPNTEKTSHTYEKWHIFGTNEESCLGNIVYAVCTKCNHIEWEMRASDKHKWETETVKPTCTSQGYDKVTCSVCGKSETNNFTDPTGHTWNDTYSYDSSYHWLECKNCDAESSKSEHSQDESGCTVCGSAPASTVGVVYALSEDETYATVTGYNGSAEKVLIASEYLGVSVKAIAENAFKSSTITSIILPETVTEIGEKAFYDSSRLNSVTMPGVTSIGANAFGKCSSLMAITISESVSEIAMGAFENCTALTIYCEAESKPAGWNSNWNSTKAPVVWNSKSNDIANDGFIYVIVDGLRYAISEGSAKLTKQASSITEANIPASILYGGETYLVTGIGEKAFSGCKNLLKITMTKEIKTIGAKAFDKCESLTDIYYLGTEEDFSCISIESEDDIFANIILHIGL